MSVASPGERTSADVDALRQTIDARLATLVTKAEPAGLYDPIRYVLRGGGKRLRPLLLLAAARTYGVDAEEAMPGALAVEVFHNFTLVHDDIMDHADERRGRPTVHLRWDESTALLCGDYLMGLAYDLLARSRGRSSTSRLIARFQMMTAQLCEGQMLDKAFEIREYVTVDEYLQMVDRKTGALLQASLQIGGLLGGASDDEMALLEAIGRDAGRSFQIKDDLLDLTADDERWGKTIGGDLIEGKKTYLLLRALERTQGEEREWFLRIVREGGLPPAQVGEARERMARSGVLDEASAEAQRYSRRAAESTERLGASLDVDMLDFLLVRMQDRLH